MGTGGMEKSAAQKNSPLGINDKAKKKKKVLVRVSGCSFHSTLGWSWDWAVAYFLSLWTLLCSLSYLCALWLIDCCAPLTQGDSGDATDDEMVSRKTRSCKEGLYRNGPESDSIDQEDPGNILVSMNDELPD